MRELVERAGRPDVAVIDPPRAGLSQKVVRRIVEAAPEADRLRLLQPDDARAQRRAARRGRLRAQARAPRRPVPADAAHRVRRAAGGRPERRREPRPRLTRSLPAMPVTRVSRFGFVNAYLVEEDDGLTVVDTMLPRSAKAILKAAAGRPIKRIALTHAHGDHVGSLDALAEELPGVEVADLRARRAAAGQGHDARARGAAGQAARQLPGHQDAADARARARRPDRLARGRRLARPHARPRRVPRHARRHALLRRRLLDARRRRDDREDRTRASRCRPPRPGTARPRWRARRRCARSSPTRLAPGHGKVVDSPARAMDAAIARGSG